MPRGAVPVSNHQRHPALLQTGTLAVSATSTDFGGGQCDSLAVSQLKRRQFAVTAARHRRSWPSTKSILARTACASTASDRSTGMVTVAGGCSRYTAFASATKDIAISSRCSSTSDWSTALVSKLPRQCRRFWHPDEPGGTQRSAGQFHLDDAHCLGLYLALGGALPGYGRDRRYQAGPSWRTHPSSHGKQRRRQPQYWQSTHCLGL